MLERKVYNNDDFAVRAATHYHTQAWQKRMFYPLIKQTIMFAPNTIFNLYINVVKQQ